VVEGRTGDRVIRVEASGDAGAAVGVALALPAPAPAPTPTPTPTPTPAPPPAPAPTHTASSGWSPLAAWIGAGVPPVAAGAPTWSGLDTQAFKRKYDQNPADQPTLYDQGVSKMQRTNFLLTLSIASAVFTGVSALWLVDWGGGKGTGATVGIGPGSLAIA